MLDRLRTRWLGIVLTLVGVIAIAALALAGQLELYIHPRYTVFTVIMAAIGGAAAVAGFLVLPGTHDPHDHDEAPGSPRTRALAGGGALVLVAAAIVALLVIPPTTLTSATAQQRDVSTTSTVLDDADTTQLAGGDSTRFTVKDWAALLRQGLGLDFFAGKPADISGFIVPTDDPDVFYVARFLVTCCAVDAQPLGVPVHAPDWSDSLEPDQWVHVTGGFDANPDVGGAEPIVLVPDLLEPIEQPAQPYVH